MATLKLIRELYLIRLVRIKNFFRKISHKWKIVIYVISLIKFITGLNHKLIRTGFFVVKNVGILFLNIMTILMVEQESQTNK